MKPASLCLIQMGNQGLELVTAYPKAFPDEIMNEVTIKSMPLNAKEGDFTSNTIGNLAISGFVFAIPSNEGRSNIASIVAVFEDMKYNPENIRKVFSYTIFELKKNELISMETLTEILPKLYTGLMKGRLQVKISSVVTLNFAFDDEEEAEDGQQKIDRLKSQMWK